MPTSKITVNSQPCTASWNQQTNRVYLIRQSDGEILDQATVNNLAEFIEYIQSLVLKTLSNEKDN